MTGHPGEPGWRESIFAGDLRNMFGKVFRGIMALAGGLAFLTSLSVAHAKARVVAHIDQTTQRMTVTVDGRHYGTWKVSTARRGYRTPNGTFRPKVLKRMHYSRKYDNAPMPYSVFFLGGYAIHGTNAVSRLGRPASHGCIRLHPRHAAELFSLIRRYGKRNTVIRITGSPRYYTPRRTYKRKTYKKRRVYRQRVNLSRAGEQRRERRFRFVEANGRRYLDLPGLRREFEDAILKIYR